MSEFLSFDFESSLHRVREGLWMFPSKTAADGVVSWWLNCSPEPVLIDCPEITVEVLNDLRKLSEGSNPRIILTNRYSHGKVSQLSKELEWPVLLQEQESYLLPGIELLQTFSNEDKTASGLRLLWTPGPTPGSCVVHAPEPWNVLFCGRLLIPVANGRIHSVHTPKTFHWTMQQKSLEKLRSWIPSNSLPQIASGQCSHLFGENKIASWDAWEQKIIG